MGCWLQKPRQKAFTKHTIGIAFGKSDRIFESIFFMQTKSYLRQLLLLFFVFFLLFAGKGYTQSALGKALLAKDTLTALQLIRAGANVNRIDSGQDCSWLIRFCRYTEADPMVFFLLRHGAKPDTSCTPAGRTALHVAAAYYACEPLCEALLKAGANINARTHDGATPLMLAAQSAKLRLLRLLLEKGADPHLKDKQGKTAYDYAVSADPLNDLPEFRKKLEEACGFDKKACIDLLKEKMAK